MGKTIYQSDVFTQQEVAHALRDIFGSESFQDMTLNKGTRFELEGIAPIHVTRTGAWTMGEFGQYFSGLIEALVQSEEATNPLLVSARFDLRPADKVITNKRLQIGEQTPVSLFTDRTEHGGGSISYCILLYDADNLHRTASKGEDCWSAYFRSLRKDLGVIVGQNMVAKK
ncbi:MAG: hypothetical protein ABIA93_01055 [Candidatus Woesearchaeota archaeon]